jgi:hypothetical protein
MLELSCVNDDYITYFFHFRIELLGSSKDLQNEIHWELLLHYFIIVSGLFLNDQSSADN